MPATYTKISKPRPHARLHAACMDVLESRLLMAVTTDANGWTVVTPAADSRLVYVSSTLGSDTNDGLSALTPFRTLAKAKTLIRNGYADQMLLRRGDVWNEAIGGWTASGRSADEPVLLGTYGSGARPLLKTGTAAGISMTGGGAAPATKDFFVLQGIDFYADGRDPNSPSFVGAANTGSSTGLLYLRPGQSLFIEDCAFRYYSNNLTVQAEGSGLFGFTLRRSLIADSYNSSGAHSQGIFMSNVHGAVFEENVFDHNGWNEQVAGAAPTMFNHNLYIDSANSNVALRRNVIARGSLHGLMLRSGGLVEDNLFVGNSIGLYIGNGAGDGSIVRRNIVIEGTSQVSPGGWGFNINNDYGTITSALYEGNIVAHRSSGSFSPFTIETTTAVQLTANTFFNWGGNTPTGTGYANAILSNNQFGLPASTYADPYRSMASYNASLGGTSSLDAFLAEARLQGNGNWRDAYTALAANAYIRAGFNDATQPTPANVTLSSAGSGWEGSSLAVQASYSNLGGSISSWLVNWGDGASEVLSGSATQFSHVFADNGNYTITAIARDAGGNALGSGTLVQAIGNVAPTLTIGGASSGNEGSTYTLSLSRTDPGNDTISRWVINWGDGTIQTVNGNPSSVTKVFADNGNYTITATATDEDGTYSANAKSVSINNVAPTLGISGGNSATTGAPYTLGLSASDPGSDTIARWVINWGDGVIETVNGNPSSASHVYATAGSYVITGSAVDEDGTWSAGNSIAVNAAAPVVTDTTHPTASLSGPSISTGGGSAYRFTVVYDDNVGINLSFLDDNDILVTGPNGFSQLARFISVTAGSGNTQLATYEITAPGGTWDWPDNGSYSVAMRTGQVRDTSGNSVRAKSFGGFSVLIAPLDGAGNTTDSAANIGTLDPGMIKAAEDFVGTVDRNDYYKFTITQNVTLLGKLYNLLDNADLQMFDSAGNRLLYLKRTGTNAESFTRSMTPGTYYIRVLFSGKTGTTDRLRLEAQPLVGSTNTTVRVVEGTLGNGIIEHVHELNVTRSGQVYLKLWETIDNVDLYLYDSSGRLVSSSTNAGTSIDSITRNLSAGTYFIKVRLAGTGPTNYRLRMESQA